MNVIDFLTLLDRARYGWNGAQRFLTLWSPVGPIPDLVAPFFAIAAVLTVALLAGVAIAALSTLLIALATLHVVLTQVLGISIEIEV
jgi:hypothetical protein